MERKSFCWKTSTVIGVLLMCLISAGCASTGEVKGGGTIVGNPAAPDTPADPEKTPSCPKNPDELAGDQWCEPMAYFLMQTLTYIKTGLMPPVQKTITLKRR